MIESQGNGFSYCQGCGPHLGLLVVAEAIPPEQQVLELGLALVERGDADLGTNPIVTLGKQRLKL